MKDNSDKPSNTCLICNSKVKLITYDSAWGEEYDLCCTKCGNTDMDKMKQTLWID